MTRKLGSFFGALAIAVTTIACSQTDPGITTAVKSRLAADDEVKAYRIDVDTEDHIVTLSGAVDTASARERAVTLARGTDGVRDVVDRLTVTPGATPTTGIDDRIQGEARDADRKIEEMPRDADRKTDELQKDAHEKKDNAGNAVSNAALTSAIKTKFLADDDISGLKIDVDSKDGVVTLTGTVPTAAEKSKALKVARETDGVKRVVDHLKVGK